MAWKFILLAWLRHAFQIHAQKQFSQRGLGGVARQYPGGEKRRSLFAPRRGGCGENASRRETKRAVEPRGETSAIVSEWRFPPA